MKKIIIIPLILLLFFSLASADVLHCWWPSTNSDPTYRWDGCRVSLTGTGKIIDGNSYDSIILPGATLTAYRFGSYNFHCDNGADRSRDTYYAVDFDQSKMYKTINTLTNGPGVAQDSGYTSCVSTGGGGYTSGGKLGYGPNSSISYSFTDIAKWVGGHKYQAILGNPSYAGTYDGLNNVKLTENFYFVPSPSLLVFGEADTKYNYYEDEGTYNTTVFFTIVNKFPLKIRIKHLSLNCPTGLSCSTIDHQYTDGNWKVTENNGMLIIPIDVNFSKANVGMQYQLKMDVNFDVPALEEDPECNEIYKTQSKPFTLSTRLIDMQNIQIGLIAAKDQTQCIGVDGMIGQTGAAFAPKVNIGFGGEVDSNNNLISFDECDIKTLNGIDNNDGVYCSQKEFLAEIGRKIAKIYDARKNLDYPTADKYSNFQTYLRTQTLSQAQIQASINAMNELSSFNPVNTGLQGSNATGGFDTTNKIKQLARLSNLFKKVTFKNGETRLDDSTFLQKGTYTVTINLVKDVEDQSSSLFNSETDAFNPAYHVEISFNNPSPPTFDWFFYDYANYEITEDLINTVSGINTLKTNVLERGTAFTFNHVPSNPDINNNLLYPTYATPFFIKVNDLNATKFNITSFPAQTNTFTYWTGFASNKGAGCDNIFVGEYETKTLPSYKGDQLTITPGQYKLTDANSVATNGVMYLETVIYTPTTMAPNLTLQTPFKVYTGNSTCDGNLTNKCSFEINQSTGPTLHKVSTLSEVFNKIKTSEICVYYGQVGANTQWNLFWNEQKILLDLNAQKYAITDANLCSYRLILDTPQNAEAVVIPEAPAEVVSVTPETPVEEIYNYILNNQGVNQNVENYPSCTCDVNLETQDCANSLTDGITDFNSSTIVGPWGTLTNDSLVQTGNICVDVKIVPSSGTRYDRYVSNGINIG